jgi:hypothetical protein
MYVGLIEKSIKWNTQYKFFITSDVQDLFITYVGHFLLLAVLIS